MFLLRIFGLWVVILGFMAFVFDATKTMANDGEISITSLGAHWQSIHTKSIQLFENLISNGLHPFFWDPLLSSALLLPAWLALGLFGSWLYWVGRKRKKIEIFIN